MAILLANIGNRNITYKDKYFNKNESDFSFKEWTKSLLENYESEKEHIKLQILDKILQSDVGADITKVILIVSNQVDPSQDDQDTIFAGEIVKSKILSQFEYIKEIIIDPIAVNVTDIDQLMRVMRQRIMSYEYIHSRPKYLYCTSGGTGQMKNGLKILLEYLIDTKRYELWYVPEKGPIRKEESEQYKKILDSIQKENLISNGLFRSALELDHSFDFNNNRFNPDKNTRPNKLALFAYWMGRMNTTQMNVAFNGLNKKLKVKSGLPIEYNDLLESVSMDDLREDQRYAFSAGLLYQKVLYNASLNRYTELTVSFAVFYEYFVNAILSINTEYDLLSPPKGDYKKEFEGLKSKYSTLRKDSIFSKCQLCLTLDISQNTRGFLSYLTERLNEGEHHVVDHPLNSMRNKIVHNGKILTLETNAMFIQALSDDIKIINSIFDKNNLLQQMEQSICSLYRQD